VFTFGADGGDGVEDGGAIHLVRIKLRSACLHIDGLTDSARLYPVTSDWHLIVSLSDAAIP